MTIPQVPEAVPARPVQPLLQHEDIHLLCAARHVQVCHYQRILLITKQQSYQNRKFQFSRDLLRALRSVLHRGTSILRFSLTSSPASLKNIKESLFSR